ncbi:MAG: hypothetical protein H0V00_19490 [Chloroflexia bacterium]|nr:hypothetical protein [Chloroflexia bacterium]
MRNRITKYIGAALLGLTLLTATTGPLSAQEPDAAAEGTPMAEQGAMMQGDPEMAGKMEEMMDQCLAMMEMMNSMMGMMGGEGMEGMEGAEDMPSRSATPAG